MFHVKLSKKDKPFMEAYLFYSVLFCLKQGLWDEKKDVSNNYFLPYRLLLKFLLSISAPLVSSPCSSVAYICASHVILYQFFQNCNCFFNFPVNIFPYSLYECFSAFFVSCIFTGNLFVNFVVGKMGGFF